MSGAYLHGKFIVHGERSMVGEAVKYLPLPHLY